MYGYGYSLYNRLLFQNQEKPILNQLSVQSAVAYSLRLLNSNYTGNAIRVRRSSDNTESDIGFVNGVLDTATLLTFCGVRNGFITTWYDQSGNGKNAIQSISIRQPRIVNAGVLDVKNSKPVIQQTGLTVRLSYPLGVSAYSAACIASLDTGNTAAGLFGLDGSDFGTRANSSANTLLNPISGISDFTASGGRMYVNGSLFNAGMNPTVTTGSNFTLIAEANSIKNLTPLGIGGYFGIAFTRNWAGSYTEMIFFNSILSTLDRKLLERNQGQFYGITVI